MVDKATGKSKNDNDKSSGSAYRSSDASGDPDVGTQSYSRDESGYGHDSGDRRKEEVVTSSRGGGYSGGSSGKTGLGSERSTTGYSGDSSRDNDPSYSSMRGDDDSYGSSGADSGRLQSSQEHSRRSGGNNDDGGNYSTYSGGATGGGLGAMRRLTWVEVSTVHVECTEARATLAAGVWVAHTFTGSELTDAIANLIFSVEDMFNTRSALCFSTVEDSHKYHAICHVDDLATDSITRTST